MATAKIHTVKNSNEELVDVCARIEREEDTGHDFVKISTWHPDPDGGILYHEDSIRFKNEGDQFGSCEMFIDNFSEAYAREFAESFVF